MACFNESTSIITDVSVVEEIHEGISLVVFVLYDPAKHKDDFIQLNIEYIGWITEQVLTRYGINFEETMGITVEKYVLSQYEKYTSIPQEDGKLLILEEAEQVIGMGAITRYSEDVGEVQRMYIKPEYRGRGWGKQLLKKLIDVAKEIEYTALRLDTGGFMDTAKYVYTSVGFREISEYAESEVPIPLRHHWFFMELEL